MIQSAQRDEVAEYEKQVGVRSPVQVTQELLEATGSEGDNRYATKSSDLTFSGTETPILT